MKGICIIIFALKVSISGTADVAMGTKGAVTITDGSKCKIDYKDVKFDLTVKDITKDKKAINLTYDFPIVIDDKVTLLFTVDKWMSGTWKKDFMKFTGPACKKTTELAPGLIKKVGAASSPKFDVKCPWKKGTLSITNYPNTLEPSDLNLPSYPYGRFMLNYVLRDAKNKVLFCWALDSIVKKP